MNELDNSGLFVGMPKAVRENKKRYEAYLKVKTLKEIKCPNCGAKKSEALKCKYCGGDE